jgi:hypothetical protein
MPTRIAERRRFLRSPNRSAWKSPSEIPPVTIQAELVEISARGFRITHENKGWFQDLRYACAAMKLSAGHVSSGLMSEWTESQRLRCLMRVQDLTPFNHTLCHISGSYAGWAARPSEQLPNGCRGAI